MITSKTTPDGLHIMLSKPLDSSGKMVQLLYAVMNFIAAFGFLMGAFAGTESGGAKIALILIGALFLIVTQRYLNKAIESEQMLVNVTELRLITTGFLKFRIRKYLIAGVSDFRFTQPPELARHPLAENGSDLLGFQGQREIINHMHGNPAVKFSYYGHTISFGEQMHSWDVEELRILLYDFISNDLRHDDEAEQNLQVNSGTSGV